MNEKGPDALARRKALTFEQAEGAEPLPEQLKPKELSRRLRVKLWQVLRANMTSSVDSGEFFGEWEIIFYDMHVDRSLQMPDLETTRHL
jgi:hypothetical protein